MIFDWKYEFEKKIITKLSSTGVYHTRNNVPQADVRVKLKRVEKILSLFVAVHVDMNMKRLSMAPQTKMKSLKLTANVFECEWEFVSNIIRISQSATFVCLS